MAPEAVAAVVCTVAAVALWLTRPTPELKSLLAGGSTAAGVGREPAGGNPPLRAPVDQTVVTQLVAAAMSGGLPTGAAIAIVGEALPGSQGEALRKVAAALALGATAEAAWSDAPEWLRVLASSAVLAARTGAPVAALLERAAQHEAVLAHRQGQERAARLAVLMVLPTGLCWLPAFFALGVAPVVISLVTTTLTELS